MSVTHLFALVLSFLLNVRSCDCCFSCGIPTASSTVATVNAQVGHTQFNCYKGTDGCPRLNVSCIGYDYAVLSDGGFFFPPPPTNIGGLVTAELSMLCGEKGWTPDVSYPGIESNLFYCDVGRSLLPSTGTITNCVPTDSPVTIRTPPGPSSCAGNIGYSLCNGTNVYIIDSSSYLNNEQIIAEINFIRNRLLPGYPWNQNLAFMSYGTGVVAINPITHTPNDACNTLDGIQTYALNQMRDVVDLKLVMQNYAINYYHDEGYNNQRVFLFSASTNQSNVVSALNYAQKYLPLSVVTLVSMNITDLTFVNTTITSPSMNAFFWYPDMDDFNDNVATCFNNTLCQTSETTNNCEWSTAFTTRVPTAAPPRTPAPVKTQAPSKATDASSILPYSDLTSSNYPPVTKAPPTPGGFDASCQCVTQKVWNDVIFVVDRSNATTSTGFSEMIDSVITLLDPAFNVQPFGYNADNYYLNTGLVFYNSKATVALQLGSSLDDFYNINSDDYFDAQDPYSNLEAALNAAVGQLSGPRRRPASRKVIVVVASTYNPAGADSPIVAANQFKGDNGVIITYDAILLHGEKTPLLSEIASSGYAFDSQTAEFDALAQAQCDANCFCIANSRSFANSARGSPTKGCYPSITVPANERLSERGCEQKHNGILVKIEDAFKNSFVGSLITPAQDTWIGLTWNSTYNAWRWVDGTPLSAYKNFMGSAAHTSGSDCVVLQKSSLYWKAVQCSVGYQYNCQQRPCDSTTWCNTET